MNENRQMKAEISFDLIMNDDMDFAEGTYRLPGSDWQVFIFSQDRAQRLEVNAEAKWSSGVTGVHVRLSKLEKLNKATILRVLSDALSVTEWQEVRGPDSMQLR